MESRRRSRNSSRNRKKSSGDKVRIKKLVCSKCNSVLYDPKTEEANYVITEAYDLKPSEMGMDLVLKVEEGIMCTNCGRKIPLSVIEERLGHETVMLLREKVKTST